MVFALHQKRIYCALIPCDFITFLRMFIDVKQNTLHCITCSIDFLSIPVEKDTQPCFYNQYTYIS